MPAKFRYYLFGAAITFLIVFLVFLLSDLDEDDEFDEYPPRFGIEQIG